jgi:hypothetical protein
MSSENFAQICQGIESETKAPNWDKIDELLPEFYEYYEILYRKTLEIFNRLKGKEADYPGPIENVTENMAFYDREMREVKESIGDDLRMESDKVSINEGILLKLIYSFFFNFFLKFNLI